MVSTLTTKSRHDLTEQELVVLAAVRTRQVLFSFMEHGSMTVSQLQEVLGWPSKSLYYQVRKLVDAAGKLLA